MFSFSMVFSRRLFGLSFGLIRLLSLRFFVLLFYFLSRTSSFLISRNYLQRLSKNFLWYFQWWPIPSDLNFCHLISFLTAILTSVNISLKRVLYINYLKDNFFRLFTLSSTFSYPYNISKQTNKFYLLSSVLMYDNSY